MRLYYEKGIYAVDKTLAISTWYEDEEIGFLAPYGNVTVNLSGYGMAPEEGCIFMPTYKMSPDYLSQVIEDIVDEIIGIVPIGLGEGIYARLRDDWEDRVQMVEEKEDE